MKKEKQVRETLRKFESEITAHAKKWGYIGGLGVKLPYDGYEIGIFGGDSFGQKANNFPKNKSAFYFTVDKWGKFCGKERTIWISKAFYLNNPVSENIKKAIREIYPDMMEELELLCIAVDSI